MHYLCTMGTFPKKLQSKLSKRAANNALRQLPVSHNLVDFSSNDYLGFAKDKEIFYGASEILSQRGLVQNGATGSRLLSGNYGLYSELEQMLADFHDAESALVFNSGYDSNIGFFSSIPQRGDVVFYDGLIHASIRDGIEMGNAKSYKFKHNDLEDLSSKLSMFLQVHPESLDNEIYVVTESVFSMDGDSPNLVAFADFCEKNNCHFIVDEAHAVGVYGPQGGGLVQELGLQLRVFARIVTFGKAMGCHGAAILGSTALKEYLVNFARSFIYTTGIPPHSLATIIQSYAHSKTSAGADKRQKLKGNTQYFNHQLKILNLEDHFIASNSAIHCCIVPGNENVKATAKKIQKNGFDVKPIWSPTVPEGEERLRFCLHSFNSKEEIAQVLGLLANFFKK